MKKFGIKSGMVVVALGLNAAAWAAEQPAATPTAATTTVVSASPAGDGSSPRPCHTIEEACKSAGFVQGGAVESKGIWNNCILPVMNGKAVAGVTVSAADIHACKVILNKKHSARKH